VIGTVENVHTIVDSPIGPLTVIAKGGALTGLLMHDERRVPPPVIPGRRDDAALAGVAERLDDYFAGALTDFDLPLDPDGTPFQRRAWAALRAIPYGETISYGELAARMGRPDAARAVGSANNRNPIAIVIPCHRVVGANGQLVGYGGGLGRKRWLLDHEARVSQGLLTLPW
jgi:methylated-DNA-[protein]-cysteine S-methyltransferase